MSKGIEHYDSEPGFHCIRLHYSADPAKDPATPEGTIWLENELKGIPGGIASAQWRQEYEIDWDAAGGELCFPQMDVYKSQIVVAPFDIPETWSLYGSFDYGHRNPSSFHVYAIDYDGDVWVVWEYYRSGRGYRQIAKAIRESPFFNKLCYLPIADPSIWAKTQQTEDGNELKSVAQLFFELPESERITFAPGKKGGDVTVAEKINGDMWYAPDPKDRPADWQFKPRLKIFATCPLMIWELGKLRYKDWSGTMQEQRNLQESIVDKDNHAFDDLKMFMTMFFMAPTQEAPDKYEKLKHEDPVSYAMWKSVAQMHDEEATTKGTMGGFEENDGDTDE
jgi:hypothetical protein